ncbi:Uncharacterised protein [Segatella copri]|nr:Uncharacterised protein [Segatella copri]
MLDRIPQHCRWTIKHNLSSRIGTIFKIESLVSHERVLISANWVCPASFKSHCSWLA